MYMAGGGGSSGADPGFPGGGGKQLCARTYITSGKPEVPYGRGQAMDALGFVYAPSCYLSLIFKHSESTQKWDRKTHS